MERPEGAAAYVIGRVRPEAVTLGNQDWPWAYGRPDRKGCPKGSRKPLAPSRRSIPLFEETEKGDVGLPGAAKNTGDDARLTSSRHRLCRDWQRSLLRGRVRIRYGGALRR